ncbi:MAG: hypothetical protein RRZ84_02780 [Romboutsia sp.]
MNIKIKENFAHKLLGMCRVDEIKEVKAGLAKQLIESNMAVKFVEKKETKVDEEVID